MNWEPVEFILISSHKDRRMDIPIIHGRLFIVADQFLTALLGCGDIKSLLTGDSFHWDFSREGADWIQLSAAEAMRLQEELYYTYTGKSAP
jgi:hypothetical protein